MSYIKFLIVQYKVNAQGIFKEKNWRNLQLYTFWNTISIYRQYIFSHINANPKNSHRSASVFPKQWSSNELLYQQLQYILSSALQSTQFHTGKIIRASKSLFQDEHTVGDCQGHGLTIMLKHCFSMIV